MDMSCNNGNKRVPAPPEAVACQPILASTLVLVMGLILLLACLVLTSNPVTAASTRKQQAELPTAEPFYSDDSVEFYFVKGTVVVTLAAVHDVSIDDPVIPVIYQDGLYGKRLARYGQSYVAFINREIAPVVAASVPRATHLVVLHYVKGHDLVSQSDASSDDADLHVTKSKFRKVDSDGSAFWVPGYNPGKRLNEDKTWPNSSAIVLSDSAYAFDGELITTFSQAQARLDPEKVRVVEEKQAKREKERQEKQAERYRAQKAKKRADISKTEQNTAEAALRNGHVYKNKYYWLKFDDSRVLESLFHGRFNSIDINRRFRNYYLAFVGIYSQRCSQYMAEDRVRIAIMETTTRRDGFGNLVGENTSQVDTIHVERRFYATYAAYGEQAQMTPMEALNFAIQTIETGGRTLYADLSDTGDMSAFVNGTPCQSATMVQMKENLYRKAHGLRSLQDDKVAVPNASIESDDPRSIVSPQTLADGCYYRYAFSRDSREWCRCLGSRLSNRLSEAERRRYALDFGELLDLLDPDIMSDLNDRDRSLYNVMVTCKKKY